jgi:hypothetical protein
MEKNRVSQRKFPSKSCFFDDEATRNSIPCIEFRVA